jgi:hypothetical protein
MTSKNARVTVLVTSCDEYSDLWVPFLLLFKRYWPDCPYDVVLVTESPVAAPEQYGADRIIACGKGVRWGERMMTALQQIQTPYILLLCDDYFLCDQVDTAKIEKIVDLAEKHRSGTFLMVPVAETHPAFSESEGLFEVKKGRGYCITTQASVWDIRFLKQLANGCQNIWDFERLGSFKCVELDQPILGTLKRLFPFEDVVHKGRWELHGIRLCERNDIEIDFSRRGKMTDLLSAKEHLKGVIQNMNPTLVLRIQNFFKLGHRV